MADDETVESDGKMVDLYSMVLDNLAILRDLDEAVELLGTVMPGIDVRDVTAVMENKQMLQDAFQNEEFKEQVAKLLKFIDLANWVQATPEKDETLEATKSEPAAAPDKVRSTVPPNSLPYREVIQEVYGTLLDCLDLNRHLLQFLFQRGVLTQETMANIVCRANSPDKVRRFLEVLMDLGPLSLSHFIDGLKETRQLYLATVMGTFVFH